MPNRPLTLDEVIKQLIELREKYPEYGSFPVHILDMNNDSGDNLVTRVELDCFSEEEGPVTSLLAWTNYD